MNKVQLLPPTRGKERTKILNFAKILCFDNGKAGHSANEDNTDDDGEADHPANEDDEDAAKLSQGELSACAGFEFLACSTFQKKNVPPFCRISNFLPPRIPYS